MFFKSVFFSILFFLRFFLNPSLDKKLGIILFKNSNYFSFNLFNFFYSINIAKKSTNKLVVDFIKKGYVKSESVNQDEIDLINNKLKSQLSFDSHESLVVKGRQKVVISKSKSELNLIHPKDHDFFEGCRNKLGWSSGLVK